MSNQGHYTTFRFFKIYLKPISFSTLSSAYSSFNRYNICSPYPLGHQRSISEAGIVKFTPTIPCKPIQNKENLVRCKYLSHLISLRQNNLCTIFHEIHVNREILINQKFPPIFRHECHMQHSIVSLIGCWHVTNGLNFDLPISILSRRLLR